MILKWIFEKWDRGMDKIDLAEVRYRWRAVVRAIMNPRLPYNAGNFLTSWMKASAAWRQYCFLLLLVFYSSLQPFEISTSKTDTLFRAMNSKSSSIHFYTLWPPTDILLRNYPFPEHARDGLELGLYIVQVISNWVFRCDWKKRQISKVKFNYNFLNFLLLFFLLCIFASLVLLPITYFSSKTNSKDTIT